VGEAQVFEIARTSVLVSHNVIEFRRERFSDRFVRFIREWESMAAKRAAATLFGIELSPPFSARFGVSDDVPSGGVLGGSSMFTVAAAIHSARDIVERP
jgi:galactokinase/mevalonate kinase-like predicted kinase